MLYICKWKRKKEMREKHIRSEEDKDKRTRIVVVNRMWKTKTG